VPTIDFKQVKKRAEAACCSSPTSPCSDRSPGRGLARVGSIAAALTSGNGLAPLAALRRPGAAGQAVHRRARAPPQRVIGILAALALCLPLGSRRAVLGLVLLAVLAADGLYPTMNGLASSTRAAQAASGANPLPLVSAAAIEPNASQATAWRTVGSRARLGSNSSGFQRVLHLLEVDGRHEGKTADTPASTLPAARQRVGQGEAAAAGDGMPAKWPTSVRSAC